MAEGTCRKKSISTTPWTVSAGARKTARGAAASSRSASTIAAIRNRSARAGERVETWVEATSVIQHELGCQRGDHDEEYVEVQEQRQGPIEGAAAAECDLDRPPPDHHEGDPEGQRQHRQQQ